MAANVIVDAVTGAVTGIGNAISGVARVFVGDKAEREKMGGAENMQVLQQFAGEFGKARNWFDSLIDGVNRLPRPFMALGAMGLLVWCPMDPVGFASAMQSYALMPEWMGFVVIPGIFAFYFAIRHRETVTAMRGPDPAQVKAVLEAMERLKAMKAEADSPIAPTRVTVTPLPPVSE